jgi:rare lipoprotein A
MRGLASWYGAELDGSPTASGRAFNMQAFTAAHRQFPLGARIKVTNLENNRSLVLTVVDRGPFVRGRLLDVSMAAAQKLGFQAAGLTSVLIKAVSFPKGYIAAAMSRESFVSPCLITAN